MAAGEPPRDRALQARQVDEEAGAPARPQRRLLGSEARLQVRARPDHSRTGHPDRRAHLGRRRRDQGGAARSDGRHQQVGRARTSTSPILRTGFIQLDQAGRSGKNPFQDRRVRLAANQAVDVDSIIKHVINGLGDRTATLVNPMAFGYDPSLKPYKQDLARAKKLLMEAGFPNGLEVGLLIMGPTVEPGLIQTTEALVSDLAKAGIHTKQRMVGEVGPFSNLVRDNKADPMFTW